VRRERPDTVVLINPNNPDGSYLAKAELSRLLAQLEDVETVIIDESFLHFAVESPAMERVCYSDLALRHPNVVLIKSMSKDFGVAGIRAGYAVMPPARVMELLRTGYLWNSNGLAEYFFRLVVRPEFQARYERARQSYLLGRQELFEELRTLPRLRVYPSNANFFLVEFLDGSRASDVVTKLLVNDGIYTRGCGDKLGLSGEVIRLAVKDQRENRALTAALRAIVWRGSHQAAAVPPLDQPAETFRKGA
jgi:histidinol-phosphate/aromatic aminotransferase/cobyric acid decarboxylase-like protein